MVRPNRKQAHERPRDDPEGVHLAHTLLEKRRTPTTRYAYIILRAMLHWYYHVLGLRTRPGIVPERVP